MIEWFWAVIFGLIIGAWMYSDAKERNYDSPGAAFILGLFLSIIGLIIWFFVRPKKSQHIKIEKEESSLVILKRRYAKGEITKKEFDKMKKILKNK